MITVTFIYPGPFIHTREYSPETLRLHGVKLNGTRPEVAYIDESFTSVKPLNKDWLQKFVFRQVSKALHPTRGKMVMSKRIHEAAYGQV